MSGVSGRSGLSGIRLSQSLGLTTVVCALMGCASPPPPAEAPRDNLPRANEAGDPVRLAQARLELAGLYMGRGQLDTALSEVNKAIAAQPDWGQAHGTRGLILASMGENRQAEESLQRAIQLAPTDGNAMHNYGWFLCQQRRFSDADKQYAAAIALPQYRDAVRTLLAQGVCQARAGQWALAERSLSRSFELDSANPVTAYNLSEVLLQRGELERARFYIRRINGVPDLVSSQSLWLAARVEHRLGNTDAVRELGQQLRGRFAQSPETLLFERGKFDE
jgi:type IV pilus assembly protein PilF